MTFRSVNPATGEELETRDPIGDVELGELVRRADSTFASFRERTFAERGELLRSAAEIVEEESEELGRLMTREMGKPLDQATSEAEKCAWVCRHYADHGEEYLADEPVETEARRSFVRREPVGPILAVMPWNFPFWQLLRHAAPALMAGNVVLLKHAPTVPGCGRAIEELFERAGFPEGAVQNLYVEEEQVADLLEDPRVRAATLTGSVPAGKAVASEAASRVKKTVLELGGSDPFVVLPSADLDAAVETAVRARVQNSGQSCIAAKRMVLHEEIADEFRRRYTERMEALVVGDPAHPATDVGPLAAEHVLRDLDRQVRETVDAGAEALCGGAPLDRDGYWYPPTVLDGVPIDSPAYREELFGPVASLFEVPDLDAAIRLANDTDFGLGASAWTRDEEEQERLIRDLEAGVVFVNEMVKSDPRLPFGGVKESGYGRELGRAGIREFVNVKTVWVE
ncbi:MAG: NAD-dependent succinate-semialdehyde dehydrogenase [Candidatus Palauibacterales bacterium]|nr:NAD-dependent succinate-semialdehyde dehydrogenase [Candidatus Palauibacterales bacterium]